MDFVMNFSTNLIKSSATMILICTVGVGLVDEAAELAGDKTTDQGEFCGHFVWKIKWQ